MNILIGFLSKIQNSNLICILCTFGQTSVAVARMSTDDASKLKSSCSRSCLGRVWSCLRDVSVLVLCCLGDVSGCHGHVSVLFS